MIQSSSLALTPWTEAWPWNYIINLNDLSLRMFWRRQFVCFVKLTQWIPFLLQILGAQGKYGTTWQKSHNATGRSAQIQICYDMSYVMLDKNGGRPQFRRCRWAPRLRQAGSTCFRKPGGWLVWLGFGLMLTKAEPILKVNGLHLRISRKLQWFCLAAIYRPKRKQKNDLFQASWKPRLLFFSCFEAFFKSFQLSHHKQVPCQPLPKCGDLNPTAPKCSARPFTNCHIFAGPGQLSLSSIHLWCARNGSSKRKNMLEKKEVERRGDMDIECMLSCQMSNDDQVIQS